MFDAVISEKVITKTYEYFYDVTKAYSNVNKNSIRISVVSAIDYYLRTDSKYLRECLTVSSAIIKNRLGCGHLKVIKYPNNIGDVTLSEKNIKKIKNKFKYSSLVIHLVKVAIFINRCHKTTFDLEQYLDGLEGSTLYTALFKVAWLVMFNAMLGSFYLPLFLDIGFTTLSTGQLKESIKDFKQYGELFSFFNYYIGVEQLCGIQSYIEPTDKRKYVHDWLMTRKDKKRDRGGR